MSVNSYADPVSRISGIFALDDEKRGGSSTPQLRSRAPARAVGPVSCDESS